MSFGVYQMYGIIQLLVTIHSINRDNIKYECCLLHICGLSALNAILYMMSEIRCLHLGSFASRIQEHVTGRISLEGSGRTLSCHCADFFSLGSVLRIKKKSTPSHQVLSTFLLILSIFKVSWTVLRLGPGATVRCTYAHAWQTIDLAGDLLRGEHPLETLPRSM